LIAKEKLYRPAGYIVFETKTVFPSSEKFPAPGKMSKKAPKGAQSMQFWKKLPLLARLSV
jgi:hypothetical protein